MDHPSSTTTTDDDDDDDDERKEGLYQEITQASGNVTLQGHTDSDNTTNTAGPSDTGARTVPNGGEEGEREEKDDIAAGKTPASPSSSMDSNSNISTNSVHKNKNDTNNVLLSGTAPDAQTQANLNSLQQSLQSGTTTKYPSSQSSPSSSSSPSPAPIRMHLKARKSRKRKASNPLASTNTSTNNKSSGYNSSGSSGGSSGGSSDEEDHDYNSNNPQYQHHHHHHYKLKGRHDPMNVSQHHHRSFGAGGDNSTGDAGTSNSNNNNNNNNNRPLEQPKGWRVKLYRLNTDGSWDDCGTGRIQCLYKQ